jgi:hypothetical protein
MGELVFYDSLSQTSPQTLDAKEVCRALGDIAGGIFSFPEVEYVPVWKAWFKYLLPDLILRADDPANFNSYDLWILVKAIMACFNVYPQQIDEEYPGFRDDLVATLGSRAIPQKLAREQMTQKDEASPLFADIWDERQTIENYGFVSLQEVNSSILFCLKYSTVVELAEWTASLFQIESPQWHLQLIFSLTEWIPNFKSLDDFIPAPNVTAFEQSVSTHFSFDLFRTWTDEIWRLLDTEPYNVKNMRYLNHYLAEDLRACEAVLFPYAKTMPGRGSSIIMPYD